jgi:DNA (cytosine-5)-methyltransferase 1
VPEDPTTVIHTPPVPLDPRLTVAELFAGVGGFRLGLERSGWSTAWANQWEPSTKEQHAADCYTTRFGAAGFVCEDIEKVLDTAEAAPWLIPDHLLLVGGFPCQDYSVARTLNQAAGIAGKKGVLWWQIHRLLQLKRPPFLFLENVDRLLKSPASQRGRDFAIMLASLSDLGYVVEWRVVNAADYGFPQKRRRVYIIGRLATAKADRPAPSAVELLVRDGVLARALPVEEVAVALGPDLTLDGSLPDLSEAFGRGLKHSPFESGGVMIDRAVWTRRLRPAWDGPRATLRDVLDPTPDVPAEYFVPETQVPQWQYLKGAKAEPRTHKASGTEYFYQEGPIPFPDEIDGPARTILTGEGGTSPSRFKHLIRVEDGRHRRLTPRELERLDGFPPDWTDTGMSDGRRAFMMGNALIVGIIERIGGVLRDEAEVYLARPRTRTARPSSR